MSKEERIIIMTACNLICWIATKHMTTLGSLGYCEIISLAEQCDEMVVKIKNEPADA